MDTIDLKRRSAFDSPASLIDSPSNCMADASEISRGHHGDRTLSDFDGGGDSAVTATSHGAEAGGTSMNRAGSASGTENERDEDTMGISRRGSDEMPGDSTTHGSRLVADIRARLFLVAEDIERTRRPSDREIVKSVAGDISSMLRRRLSWSDIFNVMKSSGLTITISTLRTYHRQSKLRSPTKTSARGAPSTSQPNPAPISPPLPLSTTGQEKNTRRNRDFDEDC